MGARKRNTAEKRKEAAKGQVPGDFKELPHLTPQDEACNRHD